MSFIELPLHSGSVPPWLFRRMVALSSEILSIISDEYGRHEILRRLGDPLWFQAFATLIGFDWDSSGTTTVVTAVVRSAVRKANLDIAVAGGKGLMAMRTPAILQEEAERIGLSSSLLNRLRSISRIVAKVDTCMLQDGYSLYHHVLFATRDGAWAIVQQGMNEDIRLARRYHWLDSAKSLVVEPHSGIAGLKVHDLTLDLTSRKSSRAHRTLVDLANEPPSKLKRDLYMAYRAIKKNSSLTSWMGLRDHPPSPSHMLKLRLDPGKVNWRALERAYEVKPRTMEELLLIRGIGPSAIRALALISDLVYGEELEWRDPLRFGYAFGGKDGVPYPVNRYLMDEVIGILRRAVEEARAGHKEKVAMIRRLRGLVGKIKGVYYIKSISSTSSSYVP